MKKQPSHLATTRSAFCAFLLKGRTLKAVTEMLSFGNSLWAGAAVRLYRLTPRMLLALKHGRRSKNTKKWLNALPICYSAPSFRIGYLFAVLARPRGGCGRHCVWRDHLIFAWYLQFSDLPNFELGTTTRTRGLPVVSHEARTIWSI